MDTSSSLALRESRVLFRAFYDVASAEDAAAMDFLVKAYISVTLGILMPRNQVSADVRMRVERVCDEAEREFMAARDRVRVCPTFQTLPSFDQQRVASLFTLHMPSE